MKIWDSWGGQFEFDNAYDVVGVTQDASAEDIEATADELFDHLRRLGMGEAARKQLSAAVKTLTDSERRDHHDQRPETRILAIQDPYPRYELSNREQVRLIETALGGHKVSLRQLSDLSIDS